MTTPAYQTITEEFLAELEQLAHSAHGWQLPDAFQIPEEGVDPAEWDWCVGIVDEGELYPVMSVNTEQYEVCASRELASYYAACNRTTILALLQHMRELKADKARLDSGMIMTRERDGSGREYKCHRRGLDLRAMIDEAVEEHCGSATTEGKP